MPDSRVADQISSILLRRCPDAELGPELSLTADGLGLDSIALVEVLLECEEALGITFAAELLAQPSLTVGALMERASVLANR